MKWCACSKNEINDTQTNIKKREDKKQKGDLNDLILDILVKKTRVELMYFTEY